MNNSSFPGDTDHERRLNAILAEYRRRKDAGQPLDVDVLLRAYPDLANELQTFFQHDSTTGKSQQASGPDAVRSSRAPESESESVRETRRPRSDRQGDVIAGETPKRGASESARPARSVESVSESVRETRKARTRQSDPAADLLTTTVGRYTILRKLGEGTMGSVYLAHDTTLDRQIALKVPKVTIGNSEDFINRFRREAKAAAGLKHPNICSVLDADEINGIPFITMDFIDGVPLSEFIGKEQLSSTDAVLQMSSIIAEAIAHAHDKGVVHRDLKPGNILVDRNFQPHITDFGLARRVGHSDGSTATHEGLLLGTPAYMAPEQAKGEQAKVGPQSDIYSLGVILFELLTCRLPFEGSVPEMLAQVLRDNPPVPSRIRKDLSEDIDDLCLKMLRKDPGKRFQKMNEVVTALSKLREKINKDKPTNSDATKNSSPYDRRKTAINTMIEKGLYANAIRELESISGIESPDAAEVVEWARQKLPLVRAEERSLNPQGVESLLMTAMELFEKHDYPGCIQLLSDIPSLRRSVRVEDLLRVATERELEAEQLLANIKDAESRRVLAGIEPLVGRLLKLKPGNSYARRLLDALQSYKSLPLLRRQYRFENGRLQPALKVGFVRQWFMAILVVGILACLVLPGYFYATSYLNKDDQALTAVKAVTPSETSPPHSLTVEPVAVKKSDNLPVAEPRGNEERDMDPMGTSTDPYEIENGAGMRLRLIPAGDFVMGSPADEIGRSENEGPPHRVSITRPFYIGITEVTQLQWFSVMKTRPWEGQEFVRAGDKFPVTFVSWDDAESFCEKLGNADRVLYRLPTEAEWEYACRAGTTTAYAFSEDVSNLPSYAWFESNAENIGAQYPHEVALKKPNGFGLHDMLGNAWEWCRDWRAPYSSMLAEDPLNVATGEATDRVLRGGSWCDSPVKLRSAYRYSRIRSNRTRGMGFRVVRELVTQRTTLPAKVVTEIVPSNTKEPPLPVSAASATGTTSSKRIPIFKVVYPAEVFLTTNEQEAKSIQKRFPGKFKGKSGSFVGILGYAETEKKPGTVLLRRYLRRGTGTHIYGTQRLTNSEFLEEGLGAWIPEQETSGASLRLVFRRSMDNGWEYGRGLQLREFQNAGFKPSGAQFYLFDNP